MNEHAFRLMFVTLFPRAQNGILDAIYEIAIPRLDLENDLRLAFFVAQTAHESMGYQTLRELGRDSYFERYEGRNDLGNTHPGDGPRFRGRGILQITGRSNYERLAREEMIQEIMVDPTLLENPNLATISCCWYWEKFDLNRFADRCILNRFADHRIDANKLKDEQFKSLTKAINGGYNGLEKRRVMLSRVEDAIGSFGVFE